MSIAELQQNPLVQRVIDIFDADGNGEVDFKEFIQGVSQFSVKGDKLSKLRFAFRIYDMDNDGYISNGELFQVCSFFLLFTTHILNLFHINIKPTNHIMYIITPILTLVFISLISFLYIILSLTTK